jgi:hypothetical protein
MVRRPTPRQPRPHNITMRLYLIHKKRSILLAYLGSIWGLFYYQL